MIRKWTEVLLNGLFWAATSWFIVTLFSIQKKEVVIEDGEETFSITHDENITWQLEECIVLSALMVYSIVWILNRFDVDKNKVKVFLATQLVFAAISFTYFFLKKTNIFPGQPVLPATIVFGIFSFYYIAGITYGISRLWQRSELHRKQLVVEKKDAELTLIRSQLQPHFLFNVLNNFLSMVDQKNNPVLAASILKLSNLLRYVVYETKQNTVSIDKEINFIRDYSDLQALRFEKDEISFNLVVKGPYRKQYCEPGLFIPFVENAFKFGTEPEKKSDIFVEFDLTEPDRIKFCVKNFIYTDIKAYESGGVGITATKKRLELAYPNRHIFQYGNDNFMFTLYLEIVTDESNHS